MYRLDTYEIDTKLSNSNSFSDSSDFMSNVYLNNELHTLLYRNMTQEFWFELKQEINEYLL